MKSSNKPNIKALINLILKNKIKIKKKIKKLESTKLTQQTRDSSYEFEIIL
jgi:hypothetical protein